MIVRSRRDFVALFGSAVAASTTRLASVGAQQTSVKPSAKPPASFGEVVDDLVAANRILADQGVLDAFGHVSVRHPLAQEHFLLSRSLAPDLVTAADIIEYDLDSRPIDARGRASYRERFIHSEIYRARRDVNAVIHCHTPSLIPFSDSTRPLRPMYHQSAFIAEGVPVFDIRLAVGMTNMLVEDAERGRALAKVLGTKPAALMRGHGAVVVADTLPNEIGRAHV